MACDCVCVCVSCMCLSLSAVWAEVINIHYALCNSMHVCMGPHTWMFSNNCCAIKAIPFPSHGVKEKPQWKACVFNYSLPLFYSPSNIPQMRALCPVTTLLLFVFAPLTLFLFYLCISLSFSLVHSIEWWWMCLSWRAHFSANKKKLQAHCSPPASSTLYMVHG